MSSLAATCTGDHLRFTDDALIDTIAWYEVLRNRLYDCAYLTLLLGMLAMLAVEFCTNEHIQYRPPPVAETGEFRSNVRAIELWPAHEL